uniref:DDE-1 domain-containing protein n=1 Tax=Strongyloides venezuelensis TaxID=75913 RepID=A0A0K0FFL6_STRVS
MGACSKPKTFIIDISYSRKNEHNAYTLSRPQKDHLREITLTTQSRKSLRNILQDNNNIVKIDLMATFHNKIVDKYVSLYPEVNNYHANCFSLWWSTVKDLNSYCFVQFPLIPRVLRKHKRDNCPLFLVVPECDNEEEGDIGSLHTINNRQTLSAECIKLITHSLTPGTQKIYAHHFKKWISFCQTSNINPLCESAGILIDYLAHLQHNRKLQH